MRGPHVSLADAQAMRTELNPDLLLGGVAIPERHSRREDEHLRLIAKQEAGCRFFVTQVVYDLNAAKNLVSDYRYECEARGLDPVPIVFTFSVCGSMKTLEFLRWLGVDVPRWIENDLRHATNPLAASLEQAAATAVELIDYCRRLGCAVRPQRGERLDPAGRDRSVSRPRRPTHRGHPSPVTANLACAAISDWAHAPLVAVHRNTPNSRSPLRMVVTSTKLTWAKPARASCSVRLALSNP